MNQGYSGDNKQTIAIAFKQLLVEYEQSESKIATKEEEAEKSKNQQILDKTVDYTVDNIVNSMASLQLNFGGVINELAENLTVESHKLSELKKAIAVEQEYLQHLNQVRLVADALHLLNQEHQERMASLESKTAQEKDAINQEIAQTRKEWTKEQTKFEIRVQELEESLIRKREEEVADYQYELERQRAIENDDYEENKRLQLRELTELEITKNKDWFEREKYLEDHLKEFTSNQEKIAGFEVEIQEKYNKAKGSAIKEADNKYKVEAELQEKDWFATEQGYELKTESLTVVIERQTEQITGIMTQLQEANTQAQNLALQAFQNTNK